MKKYQKNIRKTLKHQKNPKTTKNQKMNKKQNKQTKMKKHKKNRERKKKKRPPRSTSPSETGQKHDLFQEMSQEIVQQMSKMKNPKKRRKTKT